MSIQLLDPTGKVEAGPLTPERRITGLKGRRVGYIFNQHVSAIAFWKGLEQALETQLRPLSMHRIYKANTWAPAPKAEVEQLIKETDFAVVGVGA